MELKINESQMNSTVQFMSFNLKKKKHYNEVEICLLGIYKFVPAVCKHVI